MANQQEAHHHTCLPKVSFMLAHNDAQCFAAWPWGKRTLAVTYEPRAWSARSHMQLPPGACCWALAFVLGTLTTRHCCSSPGARAAFSATLHTCA
jgi:hypothetical protein